MSRDTDHDLYEDDEEYVEDEALIIFERLHNEENVPSNFSSATVLLDASPSSSLKWDDALKSADNLIDQGIKIVFDFDLGISKPLEHEGQFRSLAFALTHFRETVWPQYSEHTSAAILSRSKPSFENKDSAADYFSLLASHLPDDCPLLLLFDCQDIQDPSLFSLLTTQDRYPRFRLALKQAPFAIGAVVWGDEPSVGDYIGRNYVPIEPISATVGILLPTFDQQEKVNQTYLKQTLEKLLETKTPFKIISEEFLTMEWEGLETIILTHTSPSLPVKRALDGFIAASGKVIDENEPFIL